MSSQQCWYATRNTAFPGLSPCVSLNANFFTMLNMSAVALAAWCIYITWQETTLICLLSQFAAFTIMNVWLQYLCWQPGRKRLLQLCLAVTIESLSGVYNYTYLKPFNDLCTNLLFPLVDIFTELGRAPTAASARSCTAL